MAKKEPSSLILILSLTVTGLVSGLLLSGIFTFADPMIKANQAEAIRKASFRVLPGSASFKTLLVKESGLEPFEGGENEQPVGEVIYQGLDENQNVVGYAIKAAGNGFMDKITVLYGYKPTTTEIVGFEVLDNRETPGLGDKIVKDPAFLANFNPLQVKPEIVPNKKPPRTENNQVDTISGATISSVAVIDLLNVSVKKMEPFFPRQNPVDQSGEGEE